MPDRDDYISTFRRICEQANRSAYSISLQNSTPSSSVDNKFTVSFGVGGLVTLLVEPALYEELRADLNPHMRKILRDEPAGSLRKIEFYPTTS
jgi:hypothetical protein